MRTRLLAAILACSALTACQSIKEALTANTTVVARAGSQELPVARLAALFAKARIQVEPTKENAQILANIWANYMRLAYAGAHNDSLGDKIDAAITPLLNSERVMLYQDSMRKAMKVDSATEEGYNTGKGDMYAARHILLKFPDGATDKQKDSVRKAAKALRPQITAANFVEMAKKKSQDEGSAARGGDYPPFAKGQMVPEFSNGTAALKPGDISDPIETQFGMHIILRQTYAEVKDAYATAYTQNGVKLADSLWRDGLFKEFDIKVKTGAGAVAKDAVKNESQHRKDKATLVSYKGGEMTVARFLDWLQSIPPQYNIKPQLVQAADSIVEPFLKQMALQEVFLKKATEAKIDVPETEKKAYREQFKALIIQTQEQLGVSNKQLSDSAKSTSEKEALAAKRIEALIDRLMAGEGGQPPQIPPPVISVLDAKYEATISGPGLDRVVEEAKKMRASADSAQAAGYPPTQVPIPGGRGGEPPLPTTPPVPPATKKPPT